MCACMEHECWDCGEVWFDNKRFGRCPKCGSRNVSAWFDEEPLEYEEERNE